MERLNQDELLRCLDVCWSLYKTSQDEHQLMQQAYGQIEELILCDDMVQQYRDEMEAEQAETELNYIEIILDLHGQLIEIKRLKELLNRREEWK